MFSWQLTLLPLALLLQTSQSARVTQSDAYQCCCKQDKCETGFYSNAVYNPDANLCCKMKKHSCGSLLTFSGYSHSAPNTDYCKEPQHSTYQGPDDASSEDDSTLDTLKPGSPGHTVHTYCDLGGGKLQETESNIASTKAQKGVKNAIVKSLVKELASNSLDKMAKEIFSLYVCVRWAPNSEFSRVAEGEMSTGQMKNKSVLQHYKASSFVPMRCSKNIDVYGDAEKGRTQFERFEAEADSLVKWYDAEGKGAVAERLQKLQSRKTNMDQLENMSKAFDLEHVESMVKQCPQETGPMLVNTFTANTEELLSDCAAAAWWLAKLRSWHQAMPFVSFLSPNAEAVRNSRPEEKEQAVVCFGKRVASQLHRRQDGDHLLADQSMVGCHGFWELSTAAKMLNRIVRLWRPPTCQLAAMELDLKMKIMEVIADMNSNLFDALPALLLEEMDESDDKPLKASHGVGIVAGLWNSVVTSFKSLKGNYVRLGQMLGNTVVKWVVCPLKPIDSQAKLNELDSALDTEDDVSRYYAQIAYSEWTGKQDLLPGEDCTSYEIDSEMRTKGLLQCSIGIMQEDMPEPYRDEEFICPVRPLLPAKQQLEVFQKRSGLCLVHMNQAQMSKSSWIYRGRTPQKKQYSVVENLPAAHFQYMKLLDFHSRPDSEFHLWRTFVTVGNGCTQEELVATPRWCRKPHIANDPSLLGDLVNGAVAIGGVAGSLVGAGLEAAGVKEKAPSNSISKESTSAWIWGAMKNMEKTIRATTDGFLGRSAKRYDRLHKKMFAEVEAAELLHGSSFQVSMEKTGSDSKDRQKFERFGLLAPCSDFNPEREFALRYRWTERALSLARKGHLKFGTSKLDKAGAFRVQLRGAGVLHMKDATHAWVSYASHIRAASAGDEFTTWNNTKNPFLMELTGTHDTGSDTGIHSKSLQGFEVTFACGTRQEMHDLPLDFGNLPGSFAGCVTKGPETNENLRKLYPDEPFLKGEVVVRATFRELDHCFHEADRTHTANQNETSNPVFKNFVGLRDCMTVGQTDAGALPEDLQSSKQQSTYRGMLLGSGLPTETLTEVLIDPVDFLTEINWKY